MSCLCRVRNDRKRTSCLSLQPYLSPSSVAISPVESPSSKTGIPSISLTVFLATSGANALPTSAIMNTKARYASTTAGRRKFLKNKECRCWNLTNGFNR